MDGLRAINVYAVLRDDTLTLIDGGWAIPESREHLSRQLKRLGRDFGDIGQILVTHVHRDHYTLASVLGLEFGSIVHLGAGERRTIERIGAGVTPDGDPTADVLRRAGAADLADQWHQFHDRDLADPTMWRPPDHWLEDDHDVPVGGTTIRALQTPGHTQGHFVFADLPNDLLFSGDHVLPTITPSIGFEPAPAAQPLGDFLQSLARIRDLPDLQVLPAHGPVGASAHQRVDELLEFHEERLASCLALVGSAPTYAYGVAQGLSWTRRETAYNDLDTFNRALAAMETLFHLDLLAARGLCTVTASEAGVAAFVQCNSPR
jgi:glyoxylase-like metal-dependent hydrolase (beta-lactamase superfamily II)